MRMYVPMRWKLLIAFAAAYTLVFGFIAYWVIDFATDTALAQLELQLENTASGGSQSVDDAAFVTLITTVPAVPDAANPTGYGYPDSPLFTDIATQLKRLTEVVPAAQPYTYFRDPKSQQMYFAVSAGALATPPRGVTYKQPVAVVSTPESQELMEQGLQGLTTQPAYTDALGDWISAYAPLIAANGTIVGGIGVDYPLTYVHEVAAKARWQLAPVLVVSYLVLLGLVVLVSSMVVRPLRKLTAATKRVAEGEYDIPVQSLVGSRFPDELYELGASFETMARKVEAREQSLTREVRRLQVQIDQDKRDRAVAEITETDFFSDLESKAATLRARMHEPRTGPRKSGTPEPIQSAPVQPASGQPASSPDEPSAS